MSQPIKNIQVVLIGVLGFGLGLQVGDLLARDQRKSDLADYKVCVATATKAVESLQECRADREATRSERDQTLEVAQKCVATLKLLHERCGR